MNAFTKVLVVLVLLLSVGFAASQIVLYGKRQRLHDVLVQTKGERDAKTTEVADITKKYNDATDAANRTLTALNVQIQALKTSVDDKTQEAANLQGRLTTEQANVASANAVVKSQLASIDALNANIKELQTKTADLSTQLAAKVTQVADLTETVKQKNANIGDLEQQLTAVKKDNKKLADANDDMTAQLQDLVRRNIDITPLYGPPISGKVLAVDAKLRTAVIDKGSVAGVKPNTQFAIYRDSLYVGRMVITDVDKQVAVGRVDLLAQGREPQMGDDATTQIR